jgi:Holliday junction resolvase RusA-like endonuclease
VVYLDCLVLGHPRSQPRPRVYGRRVLADSPVSAAWKAEIVAAIVQAGFIRPAADAPLELNLEIALPTVQKARHGLPAIGRPDLDNLAKAAADALMEPGGQDFAKAVKRLGSPGSAYAGVISDDAQIVRLITEKRWSQRPGGIRIILRDA